MTIDELLPVLIAHDAWATDQLIAACRSLSDQQLDPPFEMGHGSLRATLIHMVDVIGGWHASLAGTNDYQPLDAKASVSQIAETHRLIAGKFEDFCRAGSPADVLHATRGTRSITSPKGVLVTHILTHGTHHRAQALNMLRQLGVTPLPQSSVMQWSIATGISQLKTVEETKS